MNICGLITFMEITKRNCCIARLAKMCRRSYLLLPSSDDFKNSFLGKATKDLNVWVWTIQDIVLMLGLKLLLKKS